MAAYYTLTHLADYRKGQVLILPEGHPLTLSKYVAKIENPRREIHLPVVLREQ